MGLPRLRRATGAPPWLPIVVATLLFRAGAMMRPAGGLGSAAGAAYDHLDRHEELRTNRGSEELRTNSISVIAPVHAPDDEPGSGEVSFLQQGEKLAGSAVADFEEGMPVQRQVPKYRVLRLKNFPRQVGIAQRNVLNGKYIELPDAMVNGKPVFVGGYGQNFFIYFCGRENDWRIGVYIDWGPEMACRCHADAHTARGVDLLRVNARIEFPGVQDGERWHSMLDKVPHIYERGEQDDPPELPSMANGTNPWDPLELEWRTSCTTTSTQMNLYGYYPSPGGQPGVPAPAPNVNVNLNLNLHLGHKNHSNIHHSARHTATVAVNGQEVHQSTGNGTANHTITVPGESPATVEPSSR